MNKKNLRKGFTTVELVIVIAIIAILATALIPTFGNLINKANETAALMEAREAFNNALADDLNIFTGETAYILVEGKTGTDDDIYYPVVAGKLDTKSTVKKDALKDATVIITAADAAPYYACVHAEWKGSTPCNVCDDVTAHEHCTFCNEKRSATGQD